MLNFFVFVFVSYVIGVIIKMLFAPYKNLLGKMSGKRKGRM